MFCILYVPLDDLNFVEDLETFDQESNYCCILYTHTPCPRPSWRARCQGFRPCWALLLPRQRQVSLHTCPKALERELKHVFPGVDLTSCLAVPTSQKATLDLVGVGDPVETEKDRLLNSVSEHCRELKVFRSRRLIPVCTTVVLLKEKS